MNPLVSVICVSFNHARFVLETLESVRNQTYPNVELIIVDDGSTDESASMIQTWVNKKPTAIFINCKQNIGYTKAFNQAFRMAKGEFYIDLAADDVLLPNRIEKGIEAFQKKGAEYAIQFGDANLIDVDGKPLGKHSDRFPHAQIPEGDLYVEVIHRYFICSPTMLIRKSVVAALGGYDEDLHYEDYDLWIRIGRNYKFLYLPDALMNRRIVPNSLGHQQFQRKSKQLESTFKVCEKILNLNRTQVEKQALNKRIFYEFRQNLRLLHLSLCLRYTGLLIKNVLKKL